MGKIFDEMKKSEVTKFIIEKMAHYEAILIIQENHNNLSRGEKVTKYHALVRILKNKLSTLRAQNRRDRRFRGKYKSYLNSLHWKELRLEVFRRDGFTCVLCEKVEANHCHHLCYTSIVLKGFSERFEVVSLCQDCHEKVHGRKFFNKKSL